MNAESMCVLECKELFFFIQQNLVCEPESWNIKTDGDLGNHVTHPSRFPGVQLSSI